MKRSFVLALLVAGLVLGTAGSVFATGSVTVATGGGSISADTVGGSSTALTGPVIAETDEAGMSTGSMILNAPAGFHFDTSAAVTITVTDNIPGGTFFIRTPKSTQSIPLQVKGTQRR